MRKIPLENYECTFSKPTERHIKSDKELLIDARLMSLKITHLITFSLSFCSFLILLKALQFI